MSTADPLSGYVTAGDARGAGEWLVTQFGREVVGLCRAIVRDPTLAQDLAQDVFIRALTHLEGFRGEASPRTWILRIARNRCIDHLRSAGKDRWDGGSAGVEDPDLLPEEPALPEVSFGQRIDLRAALDALTAGERALVVLRVLHGLDYAELSEEMGVGEGALRMRYARVIAKLREALEGEPLERSFGTEARAYARRSLAEAMPAPPRAETSMRDALNQLYFEVPGRALDAIRERLARL
jgi:RNA polymerase sigma-70 factor (ECF subfamily)